MQHPFERVAAVSEVPANGRLEVVVDDTPVLLLRVGQDYHAVEDVCSHDGQPLTDGPVHADSIECPRHGARFDLRTGRPLCMPATEGIAVYRVKVEAGEIYVAPPE